MSEPKATTIAWSGKTDKGRFRKNNEDAFVALRFDTRETQLLGSDGELPLGNEDYLFAVSDGMGGSQAGEFASRIAVDKISKLLPRSFHLAAAGLHDVALDMLPELYEQINSEIIELGEHYEECRGMGATLSLCWFGPRRMLFAHIGDSRIYYLPNQGPIVQVSHDHNHVWRQLKAGKIGLHQYLAHNERHILERALGGRSQNAEPQVGVVEFAPGDQFFLCSDGVSDVIFSSRIDTLSRQPPPLLKDLTPAARFIKDGIEAGSRDNLTALWIRIS